MEVDSWKQNRPQVWLSSAAPASVPSEEENFTKCLSGTLWTTSGSEKYTDMP